MTIENPLRIAKRTFERLRSSRVPKEKVGIGTFQVVTALSIATGGIAANTPDAHSQIVRPDTRVRQGPEVGFPSEDAGGSSTAQSSDTQSTEAQPVEAAVPITGEQVAPKDAGVDIREAPAANAIDLSPQNIERVASTLTPPIYTPEYPGKDPSIEKRHTEMWLKFHAASIILGDEIADSFSKLYKLADGYKPLGPVGLNNEANIGLWAFNPGTEAWPHNLNPTLNIQFAKVVLPKVNSAGSMTGGFFLEERIVLGMEDTPRFDDMGVVTQQIFATAEAPDITLTVARGLVAGKQRGMNARSDIIPPVKDPAQLKQILDDPSSRANIEIRKWVYSVALAKLDSYDQKHPGVLSSQTFAILLETYRSKKGNPDELEKFLEKEFATPNN